MDLKWLCCCVVVLVYVLFSKGFCMNLVELMLICVLFLKVLFVLFVYYCKKFVLVWMD